MVGGKLGGKPDSTPLQTPNIRPKPAMLLANKFETKLFWPLAWQWQCPKLLTLNCWHSLLERPGPNKTKEGPWNFENAADAAAAADDHDVDDADDAAGADYAHAGHIDNVDDADNAGIAVQINLVGLAHVMIY